MVVNNKSHSRTNSILTCISSCSRLLYNIHHTLLKVLLFICLLFVNNHLLQLLPLTLLPPGLSLFNLPLHLLLLTTSSILLHIKRPLNAIFLPIFLLTFLFFFLLFLFLRILMINSIIQFRVVIRFVLTVDFFHLGSKFYGYFTIYHHVLDAPMQMMFFIDMRPRAIEGSKNNTLGTNILYQGVLG